ncbi:hypothetical protein EDF88_0481 [Buttiauxella sp. BIGb0552]|uniref:hypothetical protein n=1 Tax=Buttiauxella sp. BIGb0552 TaxID=2485120 RepID=UPI001065E22B|nr:hypothetical protein [Buttiauxella sp. BIGb0552]TDX20280.1 hypothetical protein EDF88_0481 [Buttiauxella sp. BIGb0552]
MKTNFEYFWTFITEQKAWFEQHLAADFAESWDGPTWTCGSKGSGWLRGNGKSTLRFDEISRLKGIVERHAVAEPYQLFMKAMLVVVYRGRNNSISPAVAMATLVILKRWYCSLIELTGQTHPLYLTTNVISRAMEVLTAASKPGDTNTDNYKGRCVTLQKLVNHHAFTLVTLQYVFDGQYTSPVNLTRKVREMMDLKKQDRLDDTTTNGEEALITIRGFLNIVSLIQRVESDSEKIALNCLILLIITGFRSIEAFNLRKDALIKRQIDDPAIRSRLQDKGLPDYFLGIRYVGVKGAGERTHWVEPLAVPLVESIFSTVKLLTSPMRNHLINLRSKKFTDYLPQSISNLHGEMVELDDVVTHIAQTTSNFRGRAGLRDKASKALAKQGILPTQQIPGPRNSKAIYFSKTDLSHYLKNEFDIIATCEPCTHAWEENGKHYEVKYEDSLFLYAKGSLSLRRTLVLKATPLPLDNRVMNKFLGNVTSDCSVFSKYQLLEDDGHPTRLRTHIPRHNINTFLAIAEISDHLQAMLMGRVDISQNQHYQHLALRERRKAASLISLQPTSSSLTCQVQPVALDIDTPLAVMKHTGYMAVTDGLSLDNNIKANLHTFDDRDDIAGFIEASLDTGLFEDIAAAFEEINRSEGRQQASDMVQRHAVLHPMKLGSCMRDINLWGCPYRMKCQALKFCEHFTLTGRIDEYPAITAKKHALQRAKNTIEQFVTDHPDSELTQCDIEKNLLQLDVLNEQLRCRADSQQLVTAQTIMSGEIKVEGEIRTLAQLFSLEHQKLKQDKS